jgi:hypothetical protein
MTPIFVKLWHINTPSTGIIKSFPTASPPIAPRGNLLHWPLGILSLANAEPRQMRPRGTDAAPINEAVSIKKERGGRPSGAEGICVPGTPGTNKAFRGGTREMINETIMESDAGDSREVRRNVKAIFTAPWRRRLTDEVRGLGTNDLGRISSFSEDSISIGVTVATEEVATPRVSVGDTAISVAVSSK